VFSLKPNDILGMEMSFSRNNMNQKLIANLYQTISKNDAIFNKVVNQNMAPI